MKLNLGSGLIFKKGYVNFDALLLRKGAAHTNVVGWIEAPPFKNESFDEIFCSHVIEHFCFDDALILLQHCFNLLKSDGVCIMEGPCILGGYDLYVKKQGNVKKYIQMLYGLGPIARKVYGELARHKSGWTGEVLAEEMSKIGFNITHIGVGLSHGVGKRDFRVEGGKP